MGNLVHDYVINTNNTVREKGENFRSANNPDLVNDTMRMHQDRNQYLKVSALLCAIVSVLLLGRRFMTGRTMALDLLTLDAAGLQSLLVNVEITSVELAKQCLAQIKRHDKQGARLNAMIAVMPEDLLLSKAAQLDRERKEGKVRGPLHGIPIIVKVNMTKISCDIGLDIDMQRTPLQHIPSSG